MFKKTPGSTLEHIYLYDCWVPKLGYGINCLNGQLEETDILKRANNKKDQYWERTPLPLKWAENGIIERKKQHIDKDYVDQEMEIFRSQEWNRRFRGVWFYNNGVPTYITGEHYMYLNWWHLDKQYPNYRNADRKRYYVQQYCMEDPKCGGMLDVSNRRSGKSYRAGLFLYNQVSMAMDANGGLQSKSDKDARNLFKGKIITPFRRLPDFFRPEVDVRVGNSPEKELRFIKTPGRGRKAIEEIGELGLNSFINFMPSEKFAYDGWKLQRYVGDEVGKTADVSVYDRWQVVKYCLILGQTWIGKALLTSTVEFIDNEKEDFEKLWLGSDPSKRNKNGQTSTGLYKYFTPAYEVFEIDEDKPEKYGNAAPEEGKVFYLNTREGLMEDPKALENEIKKNPFTEAELFRGNADKCLYNAGLLNNRMVELYLYKDTIERGNFVWENGKKDTRVIWQPSGNGRWQKCWLPDDGNRVEYRDNMWYPRAINDFVSGCDPFDHDTPETGGSKASSSVKRRRNLAGDDIFTKCHVCFYHARPPIADLFYEDMILQCVFFGCQILIENNKPGIIRYFRKRGYAPFLVHLLGYKEPGIPSTVENKKDASIMAEAYIEQYSQRMFFHEQIKQALAFDIKKTEPSDAWMAFLWTEYADNYKYFDEQDEDSNMIEVSTIMREYEFDENYN